jgi:hypothetical protein
MKRRDFILSSVSSGLVGATMLAGLNEAHAESESESKKKKTSKRSLIMYASRTNNTTKVAERFKSTLERNGWQCDIFKIQQKGDAMTFPYYNFKDYDLICIGSGINMHAPYEELLEVIRVPRYHGVPGVKELVKGTGGQGPVHEKIVLSPDFPKCISFVTFGGLEFGPWEVQPALDLINVEMAHNRIMPVGTFCCPGRFLPYDIPSTYYNDLLTRPNEKDLMRAELFMEQIQEAIAFRPPPTIVNGVQVLP